MWDDFADYIMETAGDEMVKIAEVGIVKFDQIARKLSCRKNITLIKTDILPKDSTVIRDDITNPNMELYEGTDIIYSIRPPSELQPHLLRLAGKIGAQLIIKPLTNEDLNTGRVKMKLKNHNRASFYFLK